MRIAETAEYAIDRGQVCIAAGDDGQAIRWFDRAMRLTDGDPTTVMLLASSLCRSAPGEALDLLESLMRRRPDCQAGWVALLAVQVLLRRDEAACDGLTAMLRSFRPPPTQDFHRLADQIVQRVDAPGWFGIDAAGRMVISPRRHAMLPALSVAFDGERAKGLTFEPWLGAFAAAGPDRWRRSRTMSVSHRSRPLLGGPLPLAGRQTSVGFVEYRPGEGLVGHAWMPADPDARPKLTLRLEGSEAPIELLPQPVAIEGGQLAYGFTVAPGRLDPAGTARVLAEDGGDLWGSPTSPGMERHSARRAVQALGQVFRPQPCSAESPMPPDLWRPVHVETDMGPRSPSPRRGRRRLCHVIVPVHDGFADVQACLGSLWAGSPGWARIVVVDDGSTGGELCLWLDEQAQAGRLTLLRHPRRRGFPAAINTGLALAMQGDGSDVVLLNSDTIVPAGWLERLSEAAWRQADIGSVTPLSNDGSLVSAEDFETLGMFHDRTEVVALDRLCQDANRKSVVEIPTAIGFCMFVKQACLEETGGFRDDVFAQGYGEENDWSMRARALGWRHVAAVDSFVAHSGGRSFGVAKAFLIRRNLAILNRLHPGYAALVEDAGVRTALRQAWRGVHERQWQGRLAGMPTVLLITHDQGGGVQRFVEQRCAAFAKAGMRAIVISPAARPESGTGRLCVLAAPDAAVAGISYELPLEFDRLAVFLAGFRLHAFEIHHLLGQPPEIAGLAERLGIPTSIYVHDYGYWCPRFNLVSYRSRYCGEPSDVQDCENCIADLGAPLPDFATVAGHRAASQALLEKARIVVVPSADVQQRFARHFPTVRTTMRPWAPDEPALRPPRVGSGRVVIVGAIGPEKGYDVLLACARDAARRDLPLEFCLVGFSTDDRRLLETGRVFISGRYREAEVLKLIRGQQGGIGLLPSVWPETWCFALSALLEAGLDVVAFDIGTQAERLGRLRRGQLVPLATPAAEINNVLLARLAVAA